jgi:hypothetical protein
MNREIIFTAKEYKEKYNSLMQPYLLEYEDYEEIDFVNNEIKRYRDFIKDLKCLIIEKMSEASGSPFYSTAEMLGMPDAYQRLVDFRLEKKCVNNSSHLIDDQKEKLLILSFNKIIDFLELQKANPIQSKNNIKASLTISENNFLDFIHNVTNKELFASELKDVFNIETGIDFKIMIELLKAEGIFSYTQFASFYRVIKKYFVRDIGTQNGLNDLYKHSIDEQKYYADKITIIQNKLNMLITKHKIKQ